MQVLTWTILGVHLAVIVFNVAWLLLIPIGAWRRWRWVRRFGWRLAHLLILAVVALQALLGRACFLTIWQASAGNQGAPQPLIAGWIDRLIYWPIPLWSFAVLYVAVWVYVAYLWWRVPPVLPWRA